jgi:hypothetical protein
MSTPSPNPFSDNPYPQSQQPGGYQNPYAPSQMPAGQFLPPPGTTQYAPCPTCGNTFASKIGFTWWGGVLGPSLLTHVKCARCGNAYNGKTGKSNTTAIAIYVAVTGVIGLILAIVLIAMQSG